MATRRHIIQFEASETLPDAAVLPDGTTVIHGGAVKRVVAGAWLAANLSSAIKGAWQSPTTYAAGDIVTTDDGASYVAALPSTGAVPGVPPTGLQVGENVITPAAEWGSGSAQGFTVNKATTVTEVAAWAYNTIAAGSLIGIASDWGGGAIPWLGKGAAAATTSNWARVLLDTPVNLVPGTTYRLVSTDSHTGYRQAAGTPSGIVATVPDARYGTTYQSVSAAYCAPFRLYVPGTPSWALLAKGARARTTATIVTASLAAGARESGTIQLARGYRVLKVATSATARVRLYGTVAQRDADVARAIGTAPAVGSGVMLDYPSASLSPVVDGFDDKTTPDGVIPYTVDNTGAVTNPITVTLTYLRTE